MPVANLEAEAPIPPKARLPSSPGGYGGRDGGPSDAEAYGGRAFLQFFPSVPLNPKCDRGAVDGRFAEVFPKSKPLQLTRQCHAHLLVQGPRRSLL